MKCNGLENHLVGQSQFESKQGNGRCGTITSRKNTLNTPCVFLDTQGGLPTFLTTQQLKKANLPKHGYVVDLGNMLITFINLQQ